MTRRWRRLTRTRKQSKLKHKTLGGLLFFSSCTWGMGKVAALAKLEIDGAGGWRRHRLVTYPWRHCQSSGRHHHRSRPCHTDGMAGATSKCRKLFGLHPSLEQTFHCYLAQAPSKPPPPVCSLAQRTMRLGQPTECFTRLSRVSVGGRMGTNRDEKGCENFRRIRVGQQY